MALQRKVGRRQSGNPVTTWGVESRWGETTLLRMISLISSLVAQLLVRDLEEAVGHALRQKAAEEGTSVEEAHRRILRLALLSKKPKKGFKEFLLEMPGGWR
jgi:hypothetical protein